MLVSAEKAMPATVREEGVDMMTETRTIPLKQHFVLIHGVGGGSWCWYKIRCLMENSGYKVSCIDLKSAGIDRSDADSIISFDDYNQPLMDFMSSLPENEQVILVGHSAGGLSITQALAAMLLKPGPVLALRSARFEERGEVDEVKRVYIRTKQDKVVKGEQQEAMIKKWPPSAVYEVDSDHSPFFSTPFVLFGLLVKAAAAFDVGCNFLSPS